MKVFVIAILLVFVVFPAAAQESLGLTTNSKEPIEVTADGSLEWHRNDTRFMAKGNALAKQGTASIAADALTANYRDGASSSMEIYYIEAAGHAVLTSQDNVAYGDLATYDLDKGLAILTGEGLKMVAPDQTITAEEQFEYHMNEGKIYAIGRPKVTRPKANGAGVDTLEADKLAATLKENADGKRVVDTLEAFDNVVIITPTEKITGAYGIYRAGSNKAELTGKVKILRGPNTLEGERAEVDLTTNISRIFGSKTQGGGRVKGVFYPNSK